MKKVRRKSVRKGMAGTLEVLRNPELMRQIRQSEADIASGKSGLSFEQVFGEPLLPLQRKTRR